MLITQFARLAAADDFLYIFSYVNSGFKRSDFVFKDFSILSVMESMLKAFKASMNAAGGFIIF